MHAMLVKQLFLEKRIQLAAENMDFRAMRKKAEGGKKIGEIIGLSQGQLASIRHRQEKNLKV